MFIPNICERSPTTNKFVALVTWEQLPLRPTAAVGASQPAQAILSYNLADSLWSVVGEHHVVKLLLGQALFLLLQRLQVTQFPVLLRLFNVPLCSTREERRGGEEVTEQCKYVTL